MSDRPGTPADPETSPADEPDDAGSTRRGPLHPALIATLVTIPVMILVGFITFAALKPDPRAPIEDYPAAAGTDAACAKFIAALPDDGFDGYGRKSVAGTTVSWPADNDSEALTLRCGVARPSGLEPTSNLQVVNPVQWFITDSIDARGQAYVAVDHRPYVALWVPVNAGNAAITEISGVIDATLPRSSLDFG